jgi:formylglycine-generating enzyme required for sulfatase activity
MKGLLLLTCAVVSFPHFAPPVASASRLIVDWGHDWGTGWYRQAVTQQANSPWRPLDQRDLNDNGTTDDDWIGGWAFNDSVPLSPANPDYDSHYPSAVFYGAAIVRVTDLPKKANGEGYEKVSAPSEGHINQNHELRDDWNLMSMPARKRQPDLSRFAGALLVYWKKDAFLNGGDRFQVSFQRGDNIGIFISRYWGGVDWGRWLIRDGETFYLSEATFAGQTEPFGLTMDAKPEDGGMSGARNPVVRTTHVIDPSTTRWAVYEPAAPDAVFFDPQQARYQQRTFANVTAVGFLAQRDMARGYPTAWGLWGKPHGVGEPIALKFNAAQARASIDAPPEWSATVELVPVGARNAPWLLVARTETTYRQWLEVWRWAVTNQRAGNYPEAMKALEIPGYVFSRDGVPGSAETGLAQTHSVLEPVTTISWYDAVAWCNALSEMEGREPAYYSDAAFTEPFRTVLERRYRDEAAARPAVFWKEDADGYRLPTRLEFAVLFQQAGAGGTWTAVNAEGQTRPVGRLALDGNGLADVRGNVAEWVCPVEGSVPADAPGPFFALGSSYQFPANPLEASLMPFGEQPFRGSHAIGFRVVRNGSGQLPAVTDQAVPQLAVMRGARAPSSRTVSPDNLAERALEQLGSVTFETAGTLPPNANANRNYRGGEAYAIAIARTEVPYLLWNAVRQWAEQQKGYAFNHGGDIGNLHYNPPEAAEAVYHSDEPVTNITWFDAVVWLNALSELCGREPVYRDPASGEPLRDAGTLRLPMYPSYHYFNPGRDTTRRVDTGGVFELRTDTQANGFRMPTFAELRQADPGNDSLDAGWTRENSSLRTHPVGTRQADTAGLYDLQGNVAEWTYGGDALFGQSRYGTDFARAKGVPPHPMNKKENFFVGRSWIGLRPVWRP